MRAYFPIGTLKGPFVSTSSNTIDYLDRAFKLPAEGRSAAPLATSPNCCRTYGLPFFKVSSFPFIRNLDSNELLALSGDHCKSLAGATVHTLNAKGPKWRACFNFLASVTEYRIPEGG